jgi:transcriptional regulator with XRE-family HTH domain
MKNFNFIAELVKEARLIHPSRISQAELSKKLGYKNGQFVSNIERGLCSVPPKVLIKLIETLDLDPKVVKNALLNDLEARLDSHLGITTDSSFSESASKEIVHSL